MASLELNNSEIYRQTLLLSGLGRDVTVIDTATAEDLRNIIRDGLRRFYWEAELNGAPYNWRFMRKVASFSIDAEYSTGTIAVSGGTVTGTGTSFPSAMTDYFILVEGHVLYVTQRTSGTVLTVSNTALTIASGTSYEAHRYRYSLPADFTEWDGGVVYARSDGENEQGGARFLSKAEESELRLRYAIGWTFDAETTHYAISPANDPDDLSKIMFWPVPEPDAFIHGEYIMAPDDQLPVSLTSPGSDVTQLAPIYARAAAEAIYAAAEAFNNNELGVHEQRYQVAMARAVAHDSIMSGHHDFSRPVTGPSNYGMGHGPVASEIEFID